jgi:hypothetical protein
MNRLDQWRRHRLTRSPTLVIPIHHITRDNHDSVGERKVPPLREG